ncbi:MAG: hypothetical protein AABO57_16665 [Acidobacteriota bacterium]
MNEAVAKIVRLERRVMWRRRLLSLQDGLALSVAIGGIVAAGLVLLVRLRPLQAPVWTVIIGALGLSSAATLIPRFLTRARRRDAAFLIDEALGLEDRVATSHLIIERGGPRRALEGAVIEDTAERVSNQRAAAIVPFTMRSWHALPLLSLIALGAALMTTPRTLPVNQSLATERADIESAAEHLERTAADVQQVVPPETETARLATEQAELGRGFRRSTVTRADVLKKLSALEERIRQRRDDLASTRAEEIVKLADRRLGGSLVTPSAAQRGKVENDESQPIVTAEPTTGDVKREPGKETRATAPGDKPNAGDSSQEKAGKSSPIASLRRAPAKGGQPNIKETKAEGRREAVPQERPQEPVSGEHRKAEPVGTYSAKPDLRNPPAAAGEPDASVDQKPSQQKPADQKADGEKVADQNADQNIDKEKSEQQRSEQPGDSLDALKSVPNSMAEQAAKALPKLSEELLKKAAQLRANELTPADIEKLRRAAEFLSRDLAQIAQSKDLQQALQEMARQMHPEQMEKVASQLANQEKLKQELESAARLLMENQQAKEMAAGLAAQFARVPELNGEMRAHGHNERTDVKRTGGKSDSRNGPSGARDQASPNNRSDAKKSTGKLITAADRSLAGRGRESSLQGKYQQGSEGVYLYLQSKAGVGAARAPYSAGYPQYRREAERSVQRSQVPPNLRSVVRKYFDAINPDGKR